MDTNGVAIMSNQKYNCPVELTLEVIGGKWKCVILWWLRRDTKRFGELKQLIPGITQKVLTQQLRELERDGLICRETYREAPPRVEYSLTSYGETVRPLTDLMCDWGKQHRPEYQFGYMRLDNLHVLLVVSEVTIRERLQTALEAHGVQVVAVASVSTALTAVEQVQPDAFLIDVGGLGEDAYALLRQIRVLETGQDRQTPAIALTTNELDRDRSIREGFQVHLAEPFESVELVATLASLTRRLD
jgi:DNA-binding HxlR family transcriptional regulator/CheY-like chemotaxis protein